MSDQVDFFSGFAKTDIADEQAYISYCISNPDQIHFVNQNIFQDDACIKLYDAIEEILTQNLKVEINLLAEISGVPKREIQNICTQNKDFSNIEAVTLQRLKEAHTKRSLCLDLDAITQKGIDKNFQIQHITSIAEKILSGAYDAMRDDRLLDMQQLSSIYLDTLINRKNPSYKRTMGFDNIDKLLARPAEPQEMTIILGMKGSGKSLLLKAQENSMINTGTCVISFNPEMTVSSNYDRLISMREKIPLETLLMKDTINQRDEARIHKGIERMQEMNNYYYYSDPRLCFKDIDDCIYLAKKKFKTAGVLPDDGYCVVTVDLGDMIDEFSGKDAYGIKDAVNKLSVINRKHNCHIILLLQSNENNLRGGKSFPNPESCDNFTLQTENVEGGSGYAARARVVMAINRPLLLKRRFFPARQDEWDIETDVMYVNIVKQNDGKLGRCAFIFPDDSFRIEPYQIPRRV